MFARTSTIHTKPESVDLGISFIHDEVLPAITQMQGCIGLSMLVVRQSGRCIVTSSWESESAMQGSEDAVRPLRERASELLGGQAQVQYWEIAVMHRANHAPDDARVRVTWMNVDPADADGAIEVFKSQALPHIESLPGFCSASLMVNRDTGEAVSSVTFDGAASLDASRPGADLIREAASKAARAEVKRVEECELAHAHLHVPELV